MALAGGFLFALAVLVLLLWLVARLLLDRRAPAQLRLPQVQQFADSATPEEAAHVQAQMAALRKTSTGPLFSRLAATRAAWEDWFAHVSHDDIRFVAVNTSSVQGEWVLAPDANLNRRLLYIHGGGYVLGSARSHRTITAALARRTGSAVFAVNYRLMPEHSRMTGIIDCRNAWRWLVENGPHGPQAASQLFLAGDSAGGNLALALIAWLRDEGLRNADAVAVLSPQTDSTLGSESLRANLATDPMLGPTFRPLLRLPRSQRLWLLWLWLRINPRDVQVSPLFGDLAGLPPTLLQVSSSEMLLDDARRYTARARAAGSPVLLQIWQNQIHDWQLFTGELTPADEALGQIAQFFS